MEFGGSTGTITGQIPTKFRQNLSVRFRERANIRPTYRPFHCYNRVFSTYLARHSVIADEREGELK
jgi:hypothetical protein